MKALDIILIVVIAALFVYCIYKSISNARKGKCCGNCSGCTAACANKKDK